jgi:hypothetical protein
MTQKSSNKQFQQRVPTEELQKRSCNKRTAKRAAKKNCKKKLKQHNSSIGPVVSGLWFRACGFGPVVSDLWFRTCGFGPVVSDLWCRGRGINSRASGVPKARKRLANRSEETGARKRERGNGSEETGARKVTMDVTITDIERARACIQPYILHGQSAVRGVGRLVCRRRYLRIRPLWQLVG